MLIRIIQLEMEQLPCSVRLSPTLTHLPELNAMSIPGDSQLLTSSPASQPPMSITAVAGKTKLARVFILNRRLRCVMARNLVTSDLSLHQVVATEGTSAARAWTYHIPYVFEICFLKPFSNSSW